GCAPPSQGCATLPARRKTPGARSRRFCSTFTKPSPAHECSRRRVARFRSLRNMDPKLALDRRRFLSRTGAGIGSLALGSLLQREGLAGPAAFRSVAPRAKSVIFFHLTGAPSQLDLFDEKPVLRK